LQDDAGAAALSELIGMGPLDPLLSDPTISDILVNGPNEVWIEQQGSLRRATDVSFSGPDAVVAAVERMLAPLGLRIDRASPAVDARLPDGSRLHAVIPPASVDGPVIAIRRFIPTLRSLGDLQAAGAVDADGASLLRSAVTDGRNLVVSGGTGTGKTTLLNVVGGLIPPSSRIITVEDAAELRLPGHVVRLEGRPPNAEGVGEITLRTLVRHAMRLRPDRIIVGEVRGAEALDLIQAMSTGHDGSMGTVHANGPEEAMWRLETLALSGDNHLPERAVRRLLWSAIEAVVHLERRGTRRVVASISEVRGDELVKVWSC